MQFRCLVRSQGLPAGPKYQRLTRRRHRGIGPYDTLAGSSRIPLSRRSIKVSASVTIRVTSS